MVKSIKTAFFVFCFLIIKMGRKYACGRCEENCHGTACIYCQTCRTWMHNSCENIDHDDLEIWKKLCLDYICVVCRSTDDGDFDYLMGFDRLNKAGKQGLKKLKDAAQRESLFLKGSPFKADKNPDYSRLRVDTTATDILSQYHFTQKLALSTTGNGDCLFNAFSLLLKGDETLALELRYRCCVEMLTRRSKILRHPSYARLSLISPDYDLDSIECTKHNTWSSVWRIMALSNHLNIPVQSVYPMCNGSKHIAFRELNKTFKPVNTLDKDKLFIFWTSCIHPGKYPSLTRITKRKEWTPDHFVPLVDPGIAGNAKQSPMSTQPTSGTMPEITNPMTSAEVVSETTPKVSSVKISKPPRCKASNVDTTETSAIHTSAAQSDTKGTIALDLNSHKLPSESTATSDAKSPQPSPSHFVSPNRYHELTLISNDMPSESTARTDAKSPQHTSNHVISPNRYQALNVEETLHDGDLDSERDHSDESYTASPDKRKLSTIFESSVNEEREPESPITEFQHHSTDQIQSNIPSEELNETVTSRLNNKFLDLQDTISAFKTPYTILTEIPTGSKINTYFFINNQPNQDKRKHGDKSEFWDDRGAWTNGASPKTFYVSLAGRLVTVVKREGKYCTEKQENKKRKFIPLDPQPDEIDILEVHRIYSTLKASAPGLPPYKRRVTWFARTPQSYNILPLDVALVEYIGSFPNRELHGNTKVTAETENLSAVYIRSKKSVMDTIRDGVKHKTPKQVEVDINSETRDDFSKHRNIIQIRNAKYLQNKRERGDEVSRKNQADHIVHVENMVHEHPFVQEVTHLKGFPPSVILYTEQQIQDIKRFCCVEGGTVLGFDKTFNLGEFHVTPSVYKNLSVVRRETNENPICFGPMYIHGNSTMKSYSKFMQSISVNLTESELSNLTIGSDDEQSMKNAVKRSFPAATQVLCTRHLKKNANDYMENQVGINIKSRQEINEAIFGDNGLTSSMDVDTQQRRTEKVRTILSEKEKEMKSEKSFSAYFNSRLLPLIESYVIKPMQRGKIGSNWTNNNCESANHVLKMSTDWKQNNIPDFIKIIYKVVKSDQDEICRAIRGTGNFSLSENFLQHQVDIDRWSSMSVDQQTKATGKFLQDKGRRRNQVTSSDGNRIIITTPSGGRKPHQTKRKRAEKSVTPAKRRIVVS